MIAKACPLVGLLVKNIKGETICFINEKAWETYSRCTLGEQDRPLTVERGE
jgi:hypothetical protein